MVVDVELRTLRTIRELGSVRLAAKDLMISESAVSARLRRLSDTTGQSVTCPSGRGIALTIHGEFVLGAAGELIDTHDVVVDRLQGASERPALRVLVNEGFYSTEVLGLAPTLGRRFPGIDFSWTVDSAAHAGGDRHPPSSYDIAVHQVLVPDLLPDDVVAWTQSLVWVQSDEHHFDPSEKLPIVTFGVDCFYRQFIEQTLRGAGRDFAIAVSCPSMAGVIDSVRAGFGVAVLDSRNIASGLKPFGEASSFGRAPEIAQICRVQPSAPAVAADVAQLIAFASHDRTAGRP